MTVRTLSYWQFLCIWSENYMKEKFIKNIPLLVNKLIYLFMLSFGIFLGTCFMDFKEILIGYEEYSMLKKIMAYGIYRSFEPLFILDLCTYVELALIMCIIILRMIKEITSESNKKSEVI